MKTISSFPGSDKKFNATAVTVSKWMFIFFMAKGLLWLMLAAGAVYLGMDFNF